jgi:hypothetical protein
MPGCHIHQAHITPRKAMHCDAFLIDRDAQNPRPARLKDSQRAGVSRFLHADAVTGIQHQACGHIKSFLHARHNDCLLDGTTHSARGGQMFRDRAP